MKGHGIKNNLGIHLDKSLTTYLHYTYKDPYVLIIVVSRRMC